jgi:hypothetical protein
MFVTSPAEIYGKGGVGGVGPNGSIGSGVTIHAQDQDLGIGEVTLDGTLVVGSKGVSLGFVTLDGVLDMATIPNAVVKSDAFTMNGTLLLGPGASFQEDFKYTQTAAGTLDVTLDGSVVGRTDGLISVQGLVTLDGTLTIHVASGYTPKLGDQFRIVSCGTLTGRYATINGLTLGNGLALRADYDDKGLILTVISA